MTKPLKFILLICGLLIVSLGIGWQMLLPKNLTVRFHPFVGNQALDLHNKQYANPGGKGVFTIRDFQLFISNIQLSKGQDRFIQQDSYHLARFDGDTPFYDLTIQDIDLGEFNQLSFGVGIDPEANGTLMIAGDLDPNSRMAWNWQVGYKFVLLEGTLFVEETQIPLVYHIGFDESYTTLTFEINKQAISSDGILNVKVDIIGLLGQSVPIDMNTTPNVKFDPNDVAKIAKGFSHFITILKQQ